jgi:hypothetical protein
VPAIEPELESLKLPLYGLRTYFMLYSHRSAWKGSSPKWQAALCFLTSSEVYEWSIEGHHGSVVGEELQKGGVKGDERDGGVATE